MELTVYLLILLAVLLKNAIKNISGIGTDFSRFKHKAGFETFLLYSHETPEKEFLRVF